MRPRLVAKGEEFINEERYFTIWAPRQTGKSTYFKLLAQKLRLSDYKVVLLSVESYQDASLAYFLKRVSQELKRQVNIDIEPQNMAELEGELAGVQEGKLVLIIDEIEGLNPALFGQFLHSIRQLYHSRELHSLKSVIFVGVSNILGIIEDHASPFNIADNLTIPYFTQEETFELLGQHEDETGQIFGTEIKTQISKITANQPGLVNGFADRLVSEFKHKTKLSFDDYLEVEDWYLRKAIDKNLSNILNKARRYRKFVEQLLYTDSPVPFRINRTEIKELHTNGLLKEDQKGNVAFWVPLYKKVLYDAFYPETNGESDHFFNQIADFFSLVKDTKIDFDYLISNYKDYVKRRSFKAFREKDDTTGEYKSMKEAALKYSFETYMALFLQHIEAKSYTEAGSGLGSSDLLINYQGREYVVETKIYRYPLQAQQGLKQLAYYCNSLNVSEGIYLIFTSNALKVKGISEGSQEIEGVRIRIYMVPYDEKKDF